jgi:ABC-2 type transport system permease protein
MLVARREVLTRSRGRAFRFSTIALMVLAAGSVAGGRLLADAFEPSATRIGVASAAADLRSDLTVIADQFGRDAVFFDVGDTAIGDAIVADDLDAVVLSPTSVVFPSEVDTTVQAIVARAAYDAALPDRAAALGLTVEQAQALLLPEPVNTSVLNPPDGEQVDDSARGIASVSTIILLMAMSFYGNWILVGVIEEKSTRVVEVLLAAVTPEQLLVGKVLGIMSLIALQIGLTVVAFFVGLQVVGDVELPSVALPALGMSLTWLVLGLLMYNFMYAAVGATVSRAEEASSAAVPIIAPLMLGYFVGLTYIPSHPDAMLSRILSFFPLTAPLTMPARVVAGGASAIEVVLALGLMLVGIAFVIWLGARIYRGALLQTRKVGLLSAFRRARDLG